MSLILPSRSLQDVDPVYPVNWEDSLNVGRKFWWHPNVRGAGEPVQRDLCKVAPVDYSTTYTDRWIATGRGWAWDMANAAAGLRHVPPFAGVAAFSFATWVQNVGTYSDILGSWSGLFATKQHLLRRSTTTLQWYVRNAANTTDGLSELTLTGSSADWWLLAGVANGTTLLLYQLYEGGNYATASGTLSGPYIPAGAPYWRIGYAHSQNPVHDTSELSYWDRALSLDEVHQLYEEGVTGYPRTLNRIRAWYPVAVTALPAGVPYWALSQKSQVIGCGLGA